MSNTGKRVGTTEQKCAKMTTLAPTEPGSSGSTSRIWEWRGWNGLPWVQTSTQLNICGINLGVLYVVEWPTETHWLIYHISSLRNGMPSHSRKWPGWWAAWGEGAKLLLLCMVLPHATEVPEPVVKCMANMFFFSNPYFILITVGECNLKCSKREWITPKKV